MQFKGKSLAIEMRNISMGLIFNYHYSEDAASKTRLRLTKYIAARIREYSGINNNYFMVVERY